MAAIEVEIDSLIAQRHSLEMRQYCNRYFKNIMQVLCNFLMETSPMSICGASGGCMWKRSHKVRCWHFLSRGFSLLRWVIRGPGLQRRQQLQVSSPPLYRLEKTLRFCRRQSLLLNLIKLICRKTDEQTGNRPMVEGRKTEKDCWQSGGSSWANRDRQTDEWEKKSI